MSIINETSLLLPNNKSSSNSSIKRINSNNNSQIELGNNNNSNLIIIKPTIIETLTYKFLTKLEERGYKLVTNLILPTKSEELGDSQEEEENLNEFYNSILNLPLNLKLLSKHFPFIPSNNEHAVRIEELNEENISSSGTTVRPSNLNNNSNSSNSTNSSGGINLINSSNSNRILSPLSSQFQSNLTSSPSSSTSLFSCSLLYLLISLKSESPVDEVGRGGVKAELNRLKIRKELSNKVYSLVNELLDSFLIYEEGEEEVEDVEDQDILVELLFQDFSLHYDSNERTVSSLDLLLNLVSYPQSIETERLISHPVILATTEYVWMNGLIPPVPRQSEMSWFDTLFKLERFSTPRILHSQTYLISTFYSIISIYILVFSNYSHFYSFNPLAPDAKEIGIPEHLKGRGSSFQTTFIWYFWILITLGWIGEIFKILFLRDRGRGSTFRKGSISNSSLIPLIYHILVFTSLSFRILILFTSSGSGSEWTGILLSTSVSLLAWSIPFLAISRILPQFLPSFGSPSHFQFSFSPFFSSSSSSSRTTKYKYKSPDKSIPESYRSLKNLEENLGGFINIQFNKFLIFWISLLFWSLSGDLDYPGLFYSFLTLPIKILGWVEVGKVGMISSSSTTTSPIEARTTLAFTIILIIILAYFSGGRSPTPSPPSPPSPPSSSSSDGTILQDLDNFNQYGKEIAFRSRFERLILIRYFTYSPSPSLPSSLSSLTTNQTKAHQTSPLPPPLNLFIPILKIISIIFRMSGRVDLELLTVWKGRDAIWLLGLIPCGIGAGVERGWRVLRGGW